MGVKERFAIKLFNSRVLEMDASMQVCDEVWSLCLNYGRRYGMASFNASGNYAIIGIRNNLPLMSPCHIRVRTLFPA